ncbi:hypothetical protein C9I57_01315 [Trinickia symbiotica]|uniref:DUF2189 domain-containing protein n=2 Tax=Trinickia symbiotica TaxID=863227 RepID=A0A2T3Y111_9BURK|nr:hypothetical protein C9I57_01315 [Trinickia symbiotica]
MQMRTVPAEHGSQWIASAWSLFRMRPAVWIALGVIDLAVTVALGAIPFASDLVSVFTVLWAGGMMAAAQGCAATGNVKIADVFDAIRKNFQPLFAAGLVALFASLLCDFAGARVSAGLHLLISADPAKSAGAAPWFAALLYVVAAFGSAMALWLAPPLVVLHGAAPDAALKASFLAICRNPWSTLVYGALVAGLLFAALLTLGIALLVVAPLIYLSTYTASRDMFIEESS